LGDLYPYLAIARGLQARGHQVAIATSEVYRSKVEALGIEFRASRPDRPDWEADPDLKRRLMDVRTGTVQVIRGLLMPALRDSYEDLMAAAAGVDLIVAHPLTFAARLVAEKKGLRWASSVVQPLGFFSAYDPPVLGSLEFLSALRSLGPGLQRQFFRFLRWAVRSWSEPWHRLRAELGLPPAPDPLFEGKHAPGLA
jgi:UDP:flavonoid glycosyltransferase YjiC (YdhE family)